MPYVHIRVGTHLEQSQCDALLREMTHLMASVMGKRQAVTAVQVDPSPRAQWSVGGEPLQVSSPVPAYVDIKITQGTNSAEQKATLIAATYRLLAEVIGDVQEASYVVIDEIAADGWGYAGRTQQARAAGAP